MSASAVRTRIADPSGSSTFAYRLKTAIPGPIDACARSTGAMFPCWSVRSASGSSRLRRGDEVLAGRDAGVVGRGRQTSTIEEAKSVRAHSRLRFAARFASATCRRSASRTAAGPRASSPTRSTPFDASSLVVAIASRPA